MNTDKYYTVLDLSKKFGITKQAIHQLIKRRKLTFPRVGNMLAIRQDEVYLLEGGQK